MNDPRYPIGKVQLPGVMTETQRANAFGRIAALPNGLYGAVRGLSPEQLDSPYRDGGWTLRQVVHHLADSHLNAYIRHKLTITEVDPPIKAYDENAWLQDARLSGIRASDFPEPTGGSLLLVQSHHHRWVHGLRTTPDSGFARTCVHSERGKLTLDDLVAMYAWHGDHHVAHITSLRRAMGW